MVDEGWDDAHDHDRIGSLQTRTGERGYRYTGGIDFASQEGLKHRWAVAYADNFRLHGLFLEKFSIFNDPDGAIGWAKSRPSQPQLFLGRAKRSCSYERNHHGQGKKQLSQHVRFLLRTRRTRQNLHIPVIGSSRH